MGTRFCKHCNSEHELSGEYWWRLNGSPRCKVQVRTSKAKTYDPTAQSEYNKKYRKANRVHLLETNKQWRENNIEKHRENARQYYWNNRERVQARHNKYCREREKVDIEFKLACRARTRVYNALRNNSQAKMGSAVQDLGCSISDFKSHIECQFTAPMNWGNYGTYWELDHILPLANYQLSDRGTFRRLVHYTNYQPLEIGQNRRKLNKEDYGL